MSYAKSRKSLSRMVLSSHLDGTLRCTPAADSMWASVPVPDRLVSTDGINFKALCESLSEERE